MIIFPKGNCCVWSQQLSETEKKGNKNKQNPFTKIIPKHCNNKNANNMRTNDRNTVETFII